jgi:GntR family transcriptional regulator/MocR family aminotransferase
MKALLPDFAPTPGTSLQMSLRRSIVAAIAEGRLAAGQRLPPSRILAQEFGISRNTVAAVYDALVERGLLTSVPRQGLFVAADIRVAEVRPATRQGLDWSRVLKRRPTLQRNIVKPVDWQDYPYPFIYGQVDPELFPLSIWRALSRDALGRSAVNYWAADHTAADDPQLVDAICRHILPGSGVYARPENVLVTLGTQHGLYLLAALLVSPRSIFGVEDPGYPDVRNIAEFHGARLRQLTLDASGLCLDGALDGVDVAMVTPAHQCPTMVTMPLERRRALVDWARRSDAILVEDDYEGEGSFGEAPPPLTALDDSGRVIHLGTFSKIIAPGVRLGYMVGPPPLIAEARAARRLMHRNVPLNNQRTAALFVAEGHYHALRRRLRDASRARWEAAVEALTRRLPEFWRSPSTSGSSLWLRCPPGISGPALFAEAKRRGVLLEPGEIFFAAVDVGQDHFRLGLSSIPLNRIDAGIAALAQAAEAVARRPGRVRVAP